MHTVDALRPNRVAIPGLVRPFVHHYRRRHQAGDDNRRAIEVAESLGELPALTKRSSTFAVFTGKVEDLVESAERSKSRRLSDLSLGRQIVVASTDVRATWLASPTRSLVVSALSPKGAMAFGHLMW